LTPSSRGHSSANSRSNLTSSSSRYNNHKQVQIPGQTTSDKYQYTGHRDRESGISFITSTVPPEVRDQSNLISNSSINRGTFDYRSSSAISTSTSSSSGGSFISGLRDPNEKQLRFLDAAQNVHKSDIAMVMSLANTELADKQKVFI
jgi:hypothetical protein